MALVLQTLINSIVHTFSGSPNELWSIKLIKGLNIFVVLRKEYF